MTGSRIVQARGDCLRVGGCVVHVASREIIRVDGSLVRVTVKTLAVLLELAAQPGRVVSRDALLESVWSGTLPTDDVVTQAITSLRKALGDDRDAPTYVETIPKAGYRLLVPVAWSPEAPADAVAATAPRGRRNRRALMAGASVALAGIVVAALAWIAKHRDAPVLPAPGPKAPSADAALPYVLLTSRPGPEAQPALSPDGALVAYAMSPGAPTDAPAIFVQAAQHTPPRQLTVPPAGDSDHLPRWSPDGRQLMFARIADDGACALHLMPASGGASRIVGRCDRIDGRYDWLPDGSGIVAGLSGEEGARDATRLSVLRLQEGTWRPMRYVAGEGDADLDPHFSPDGRLLAFRRNLSHSDLWVMPAAGGSPRRLTRMRGNITGWDWTPDGRWILFGSQGTPSRLYSHDLATGRTRPLGTLSSAGLDIAAHRGAVVFSIGAVRTAIYRYPLPLREGGAAEPVFASTGNDLLGAPSPDGRWLAFHSDRSRDLRVWLGQPGQPDNLRMIDGLTPISRHPPQWSPDGRTLLVVGEPADPQGAPGPRLYRIDVASGRATTLDLEGSPNFAQELPGARMLAVVDRGAGRLSLRILDTRSVPWRVLAQLDDVGEARFDPRANRVYFVRTGRPGLWSAGLDLRDPVEVDRAQPVAYWFRRWALLDGRAFALPTAAPACLAEWHWLGAAAPTSGAGCLDRVRRGVPTLAVMVSADRQWLYASMVPGAEDSDIGLADLASLPGTAAPSR